MAIAALLLAVGYVALARMPATVPAHESPLEKESAEKEPVEEAAADVSTRLDSATPETDDARRVVSTVPPEVDVSASVHADDPGSATGQVRIRAIDAQTGARVERIRVRAASDTRVADRTTESGDIELLLTADTYTFLILSSGYEPTESAPTTIERDATVALEPIRLRAGSARVLGVVTGDLPPDANVDVELLGDGRGPCANCAAKAWEREAPCPDCGYAAKSSRLQIPRSGVFAFERLVAGGFAIRLVDAQGRTVGIPKRFELRAEESLPVELECVASRAVRVEVIDTDGTSLAGEWAERVRARRAQSSDDDVEFVVEESSKPSTRFACTFRSGGRCLAQSALAPPPPSGPTLGVAVGVGRPASFGARRLRAGARKEIDDRPRKNAEALRPQGRSPSIEANDIDSDVDPDGMALFEPVPSLRLAFEMRCGPFTGASPVPPSRAPTLLRVKLTRATGPAEEGGTFRDYEAGRRP